MREKLSLVLRKTLAGFFRSTTFVLALTLIAILWVKRPEFLIWLFDQNLVVLKYVCDFIPSPYGDRAEAAFRGFGADKALVLAEATLFVRGVLRLIPFLFRRNRISKTKQVSVPASTAS